MPDGDGDDAGNHLLDRGVRAIAAAVRSGETTATSLVEEAFRRVDRDEASLHCFNLLTREAAFAAAAAVDEAVAQGRDPDPSPAGPAPWRATSARPASPPRAPPRSSPAGSPRTTPPS